MKVLVTGGAGFLGSHLIDRLIAQDHEVVCVDTFFTGQRRTIEHLRPHPHFTLIEHDIVEPLVLEADRIFNFACPASPIHYQLNPIKTIQTSTVGMVNMLELALTNKARVLQASTSEVYGDPQVHPQGEDYWGHVNPVGPRSCYDEGKRVAETLCMDYHRQKQVEVRIVRIFNTYGPRMHPQDGRVVSNFIVQALRHQPITLYGDGAQTRSFCYVDDLIDGVLRMMDHPTATGPINLGNPAEISVRDLAQRIIALTHSSSKIVYQELPTDDPKQRQPDITKAKKLLDWQPTIDLEQGLTKTIDYFRGVISAGRSQLPAVTG